MVCLIATTLVVLFGTLSYCHGEDLGIHKEDFLKVLDRLESLENVVRDQQKEIGELETALRQCGNDDRQSPRKRHTQGEVAFYAYVRQTNILHVADNQNIVFGYTVTNIGYAYNETNGKFTAPVYGLYLVTSSLLSERNMEIWASVTVNNVVVAHINAKGTDGRHGSGAQTVIVILNKGDVVSIRNMHNEEAYWGDKYTTFGGFLITEYPDQTTDIVG